uniref:SRCR domain-containing protein n=1 Tax=Astyanax mexicanus TaxID=7994 RepID=A0A3B1JDZ2_ASTMX
RYNIDSSSSVLCVLSESVRLVDGDGFCSGRLEVKTHQSWSRVCETDFDRQDAEVVCRELGCGTPLTLQGALFGEGTNSFGSKEFQCKGTEKSLVTCSTSSRKKLTCTHGSAVGLTCTGPDEVRLVDEGSRCNGTVEVFHREQWKKVSAGQWTENEAAVVCRRLACGTQVASSITESATDKTGENVQISCKGSESSLQECTVLSVSDPGYVIQVLCSGVLEQPTILMSVPIRVSVGLQSSTVFRNHSFTITCITRPQLPGGSFHLKLPWTNRSHTQTAVNHSASFFFPAANDSHQGNYSCVYENQVEIQESAYKPGRIYISFFYHNFSSESELLFLTITDSSLPAAFIRILIVIFLLLISSLLIFLVFKKCSHISRSSNRSSGEAAVRYENIELVSLQNVQNMMERRSGELLEPHTDMEREEEEEE